MRDTLEIGDPVLPKFRPFPVGLRWDLTNLEAWVVRNCKQGMDPKTDTELMHASLRMTITVYLYVVKKT